MSDTRSATGGDHEWLAGHLVAGAAGLLDDVEQTRFDAHRQTCADCQARWLGLLEQDDDEAEALALESGHVPSAILARWPQAGARLRGIERETVLGHVESCAQCRQDLALLGYQPRWEAAHDGVTSLERAPGTAPARRRSIWVPWLWGGLSGAAVTAAALLLVLPLGRGPRVGSPHGEGAPSAARVPSGDGGALPWVAPLSGRGTLATVVLAADAHELVITAATPMDADPGAPLEFEVLDPAGVTRLHGRTAAGQTEAGALVLLLRSPEPLPLGAYRVTLRAPAVHGSGTITSALRFEVRRALAP